MDWKHCVVPGMALAALTKLVHKLYFPCKQDAHHLTRTIFASCAPYHASKLGDDAVHCDAGEDVNHAVDSLDVGQARMADALNVVSQSYDDSEGGMDGLVQALVCEVSQD